MAGIALHDRPVRMPKRAEPDTPWYRNPGRHAWLLVETPGMPDYEPRLLLESDTGGVDRILLLERA